jgi:putative copper resistance protein D
VVRAVHFAVVIQTIGALLFVGILGRVPAAGGSASGHAARRWLMIAALSATMIVPSGFAWLILQAADMTGHSVIEAWNDGAVGLLLFQTHAGVVWQVRFAVAAALLIDVCALASRRIPSDAAVVAGLVLGIATLVSCAWLSHAGSDAGPYASLHLAAHALHMLGVALWLGGLVPLAMLVSAAWHAAGDAGAATAARAASVAFGNIALIAVGTIMASGSATTALLVRDVSDLTTGWYAGLLTIKLGLFGLMLVLAAVNRLKLVPRLAAANHGPAAARLWWSILGELVLGLVILLVVGALGITAPGADE